MTVSVFYSLTVEVEDDATNEDVLDKAEEIYASGAWGNVLLDHEIDPGGDFRDKTPAVPDA